MRMANQKITVENISSSSRTSGGGSTPAFAARYTDEPCRIDWKTGSEVNADGTRRYFQEANVYMDVKEVDLADRISYGGKYYNIISVVDMAGHGHMQRVRMRLKE